MLYFNPRPPAEGDPVISSGPFSPAIFQSTPSRGGRREGTPLRLVLGKFQSTPSRGGRPMQALRATFPAAFQSTPSRGGRRSLQPIHSRLGTISIHALPRRATFMHRISSCKSRNFNPRPPAEGDGSLRKRHRHPENFNPRPPAEGDIALRLSCLYRSLFQSTPSRGGRRKPHAFRFLLRQISIHALPRRATPALAPW